MSKRRISHQQASRIQQKQTRYQEHAGSNAHAALADGLVIARFSRHALIEQTNGESLRCTIRPDIQSLVAGDRIIWQPAGPHQGVVVSVYPRTSVLNRPDNRGVQKPVAANITQVMVTLAPLPAISWTLLDSYLVMAETLGIQACIVLNKTDLPCDTDKKQLAHQYAPLGYPIVTTQMNVVEGDKALMQALSDHTSVFVGQSGVGKSSIITRMIPEAAILTGEVSTYSNLGCHTTSNSRLYHLPNGGHLIDSPGVREFGLWNMPARTIAEGFRELRPHIAHCQFRNCQHSNTPGCAVMTALEEGIVSRSRYDSYLKLIEKFGH